MPALKAAATRNLQDVADALTARGCRWWAEAGTCLGIVRENDFIGHDQDVDVGVMIQTGNAHEAIEDLVRLGFAIHHSYGSVERGLEVALIRDACKVDLFFFYQDGGKLYHAAWRGDQMIRLEFDAGAIMPLKTVEFVGRQIPIPGHPVEYLVARYGPDWRTPKTNWRWDVDPCCINWSKSDISRDEIIKRWPL